MSFKRAHHNKILPGTTKCQTTRRGFKPPVIIHPMEGHIPKEFGRIKLDNEDFMGNPKGSNTSAQFPTGPFPPGDAPIPMWGPDKMGEYVDGIFSQMPTFPAAAQGPSTGNDDLRILEQQMLTMQKDLAEMERHFKESLATDRPLAKN